MARATEYDAIVLDVMLPGADGFEVCRRLREAGTWSPVLMLTARDAVEDRVEGSTPARTTTSRSRSPSPSSWPACGRSSAAPPVERPTELEVGDLRLDPASRRVWRGETEVAPLGEGVRAPRDVHAPSRRGALPLPPPRALLGLRLREPLERRRRLRPLPAREDRPAVRPHVARDRARGGLSTGMSRLPIRVRLTLAFALAMAVVLAATGAFLYVRLQSSLDEAIDEGLEALSAQAAADVDEASPSATRRSRRTSASSRSSAPDGRRARGDAAAAVRRPAPSASAERSVEEAQEGGPVVVVVGAAARGP